MGMAGEANYAVSAYTEVKMKDASTLLQVSSIGFALPPNRRPGNLDNLSDPVVPSKSNFYGHPLGRSTVGPTLEDFFFCRMRSGKK